MILRAIVAVAVVAIAAPHTPRAGNSNCSGEACSAGLQLLDHIRESGIQSLVQVRSQIEADETMRDRPIKPREDCVKHATCG